MRSILERNSRVGAMCLLLACSAPAQAPRTHFVWPSPLYVAATGQFAGKGAFAIMISENPSAAQNCSTTAAVGTDPTGAVRVNPQNANFSGGSFWFDVTVTTGQLTRFSLPVTWTTNCGAAAKEVRAADPVISVRIDSRLEVNFGNGGGTDADSGNAASTNDPISTATGELHGFDESPDLALGGPLPLEFRRYYASQLTGLAKAGGAGVNWMHNFEARLVRSTRGAAVTLFRGKTVDFTPVGANWQLAAGERLPYQLVSAPTGYSFLDPATNLAYWFNETGGLARIEDRNGNALTVTQSTEGPTQVADGLGRLLKFTNLFGRITKVEDQTGRSVSIPYGGNTINSVTDANGKTTTYTYVTAGGLPAMMTVATLPAGNRPYTQEYDAQGRVTRQTDSRGNATRIDYSQTLPQTATVTDALGGVTRHVYELPGSITTALDAAGQQSTYGYDASGRPTATTDRRGGVTVTAYHAASGLPASVTDALGNITAFSYAPQTQGPFTYFVLTRLTYPDGTAETFEYDARGNLTAFTDRAGKVTTLTYNNRGQVLTSRDPSGGVRTYTYNADGTLASFTLPSGDRVTYGHDTLKRVASQTFADGSSRQYTYDGRDRVLTSTDERGKRTTYSYNDNGRLQSITGPTSQTVRFAYDTDERVSSVTDTLNRTFLRNYDELGRLRSVTSPADQTETYAYDAVGRLTGVSDSAGRRLSFGYDAEGAPTSLTDGDSKIWRYAPDALGRTTQFTDPLDRSNTASYDAGGRLTSLTDPLGGITRFSYDSRGLPTGVTLPGSIAASFTRNDLGLVSAVTDPNSGAWTTAYDTGGRRTSETDPLGRATAYSYDNRQRVRQVTLPEGALTLSYDAAGNLVGRQYSDSTTIAYAYDDNNRLTTATDVALAYDANGRVTSSNGLAIGRDSAGRIASVTYATGKTVTYEYNSQGLLARVRDWAGGVTEFTYDNARRLDSTRRPNGVVSRVTYSADGRLASATWTGGSVSASIRLQRDAAGRIVSAERNLPQAAGLAAKTVELGYDAAHQVRSFNYDRMGRLTSGGGRTYTWNLASRLLAFQDASQAGAFRYDALGQMIAGRKSYVWNYAVPLPAVAVEREGQADERYYVHLPNGQLFYAITAADNKRRFYHFDEMGSTVFLTDDAGAVTDAYAFTPYGEAVGRTGSTVNPFTFLGALGVMQIGDSGLYYMRARFYDSTTARFLSPDPVRSLDPRAVNPYQYALANPLGFADPTGLSPHPASQNLPQFNLPRRLGLSLGLDYRPNLGAGRTGGGADPARVEALDALRPPEPAATNQLEFIRFFVTHLVAPQGRTLEDFLGWAPIEPMDPPKLQPNFGPPLPSRDSALKFLEAEDSTQIVGLQVVVV